jgi:hypothetical protein
MQRTHRGEPPSWRMSETLKCRKRKISTTGSLHHGECPSGRMSVPGSLCHGESPSRGVVAHLASVGTSCIPVALRPHVSGGTPAWDRPSHSTMALPYSATPNLLARLTLLTQSVYRYGSPFHLSPAYRRCRQPLPRTSADRTRTATPQRAAHPAHRHRRIAARAGPLSRLLAKLFKGLRAPPSTTPPEKTVTMFAYLRHSGPQPHSHPPDPYPTVPEDSPPSWLSASLYPMC